MSLFYLLAAIAIWIGLPYLFWKLWRRTQEKAGEKVRYIITAVLALFSLTWLLASLLILYGIALWAYTSIRNYNGYCTWPPRSHGKVPVEQDGVIQSCIDSPLAKENLYGRRFTAEERLDIAIDHYLCNQKNNDYLEIEKAEGMGGPTTFFSPDDVKKRFTLIPYSSKDEFLRENPGCCKLVPYPFQQNKFGYEFSFFGGSPSPGNERASGVGNGIFTFKHKVRYMGQEGTRKEVETANIYIMVNNCGYPRYYFISETLGY